MIEREIKYLITKADYERAAVCNMATKQLNYYFVQGDCIANYTLRIRKKNDNYTLTLKVKDKICDDEYVAIEHNYCLDELTAKSYICEGITVSALASIFNVIIDNYELFVCIGSLLTERIKADIPCGLTLEIDKNTYLDIVDYEIECECTTDEQSQFAKKYIKQNYNITKSMPKIIRYYNRYKSKSIL